jgi:hypothetical protein
MYFSSENNSIHPVTLSMIQTSFATFLIGGIIGGIKTSRETFINFIEHNQATQFLSQLDAKKRLSDKMFLSFLKGFSRMGMRIGFFSSSFM